MVSFHTLFKASALTLIIALAISSPAVAAKAASAPTAASSPVGNDISWPQCGRSLPSGQAFGIVGVNGGLATTTNDCLSSQLIWTNKSTGTSKQAKAQLYVNTANPGGLGTASWPKDNTDPSGTVAPNPYQNCDGNDSLACAWQYGWNRAVQDVSDRFKPAAQSAGMSTSPADYPWWLDVETENTWKSGSTAALRSNVADLEGMTAYFKSFGVTLGVYSTNYQWGQIVGKEVTASSNLNGLGSWLAGARNQTDAKKNCSLPPLTAGGVVKLTQYVSGSLDYDYSCL
jgi:hypothetical protein